MCRRWSSPHPDGTASTIRTRPLAEASRRKLLDRVIAEKMTICGYHFPFPGAGTIRKDGAGYALDLMKVVRAASLQHTMEKMKKAVCGAIACSPACPASVPARYRGRQHHHRVTRRISTSVRAKLKAKDYKAALAELTPMLVTYQHADVYNLMGFSLRKTGDYKQAYTFYRKALDFDPQHKGALEYLGELYVETGQIDKAQRECRAA